MGPHKEFGDRSEGPKFFERKRPFKERSSVAV